MLDTMNEENERLKKLYSLNILDTPTEEEYDRITKEVACLFKTPISIISFIDKDRQWFKASYGVSAKETIREASFCNEVVKEGRSFVIYDSLTDDIFRKIATHPSYANPIRFYAGVPLITKDGHSLGSLCIADFRPNHNFSRDDQKKLESIAQTVIDLLENSGAMTSH